MQKVWNRALVLLLAGIFALLCLTPAWADNAVNDGKWYDDVMNEFIDAGYLSGYTDGTFGPNRSMTRAEFMTVINRVMDYTEQDAAAAENFTDVNKTRWYFKEVAIALNAGYTKGTSATTMAPNATITRQEAMTMLAAIKGLELKRKEESRKDLENNAAKFVDVKDVANWAVDYVAAAVKDGIVTGSKQKDGLAIAPKRLLTRAEGVSMLNHLVEDTGVFVVMNVPYADFYAAEGTENINTAAIDAETSATAKAGNYSITGGGYHSATTAAKNEAGEWEAVGGDNGAYMEGVTWPVKVKSVDALKALGGKEITEETKITVAEAHHGQVGTFDLEGAAALMEAPSYSYCVLDEEPAQYLTLKVKDGKASFSANKGEVTKAEAEMNITYGGHWGDVTISFPTNEERQALFPDEMKDVQLNAVVVTMKKGTKAGMIHLDNIWTNYQFAWRADSVKGLDGDDIESIRYYVNDKAGNYKVVEIQPGISIAPIYSGEVKAAYDGEKAVALTGLPEDIKNAKAVVSVTTGGRGQPAVTEYLTETKVDPADGDVEAVPVEIKDGKIALTNAPKDGTVYIVAITSDNYAPISTTVGEAKKDDSKASGKNGTFEGKVTVKSDAPEDWSNYEVTVSLTVENDVVKSATAKYDESKLDATSKKRMAKAAAALSNLSNKKVSEVKVDAVNSATLSSNALQEAVQAALK